MASPPRSSPATSPPYPHHIPLPVNNPRKRPSLHLTNTQNAPSKRRKQASIASGASSAHPLRQTSFPPGEALDDSAVRSPSVESDFTGITGDGARSAITAGSSKGKGKRGRKSGKRRTLSGSATEKSKPGARGGAQSERSATADYGGEEDGEDEDDDAGDGMDDGGGEEDMDKAAERKNLSVLVDAFGPEQIERYEMFRRVKLKKETVRKIANFTLAQSVPPAVITTINGYTKTFIGTLIERARDVQQQWAALETPPDTPKETRLPVDPTDFKEENASNDVVVQEGGSASIEPGVLHNGDLPQTPSTPAKQPDRPLGPLLPDHFREALRRYRRDGEATGTGLTGFSVGLGNPGTGSARLQGRRLFK